MTSATPNHQNVSAAEQSRAARIGAVLFKSRGWLPVPFLVVPVLAMQELTLRNLVLEESGRFRANRAEMAVLRYYANAIAHLTRPPLWLA